MADLALAFNVLAKDNATGPLNKVAGSLDKVSGKAEHTHSRMGNLGGAFSKFSSILGGEVGEAFNKVGEAFDLLGEKQGKLGSKLMAGGGALTGIGALLSSMGSKDKAAMQQFDAAVAATGHGFAGLGKDVEEAVKHQENYAHKAPDTIEALRILTQATNSPKTALEEMNVVSDLAAAKHESLAEAAQSLAKVHGGAGRILKEFGITLTNTKGAATALTSAEKQHQAAVQKLAHAQQKLRDLELVDSAHKKLSIGQEIALRNARDGVRSASENLSKATAHLTDAQAHAKEGAHASEDAITKLGGKLKGQAAASVDTFSGRMDVMKTKVEDAAASFGKDFGGAITAAGPILMGLGATMTLFNSVQEARAVKTALATAATETETAVTSRGTIITKAAAAGQWLLNAALEANPIGLVIVALVALTAGLIYAYKHSETFRSIVTTGFHAVAAVFDYVKDHWRTFVTIFAFLAGGPVIGTLVLIVTHFGAFKDVAREVLAFVVSKFLGMAGAIIHAAAWAFGWVPGIGPKLKSAAKEFDKFAAKVNAALDTITPVKTITLQTLVSGPGGAAVATAIGNNHDRISGMRAAGGPVMPYGTYLVGERGPELLQMGGSAGNVVPNHALGGGGSQPVVVQLVLDKKVIHSALLNLRRERGTALGLG